MKKWLFVAFIISFSVVAESKEQMVRVLVGEKGSSLELSTSYPVRIDTSHGEVMDLNYGKSSLQIFPNKNKWRLVIKAHDQTTERFLLGDQIKLTSTKLNWQGQLVDFPLLVSRAKSRLQVVGLMTMNRYLQGVLPHEMPAAWPLEALKVQAVASRTYALWKMKNASSESYDLKPSVADQVFKMERFDSYNGVHPSVGKALSETENMYLATASSKKVVKAYFHSDCGGDTESADVVWGQSRTHTSSVRDVACARRKSDWQSQWSFKDFRQKLMREFVLPDNLHILDVVVRAQSKSQRVENVDILFNKGFLKRVSGEDLRRILGYDKIKSTLFAVQTMEQQIVFSGRGHGHGVGMCQWGARAMAASGKTYRDILKHYYPRAYLITPDESINTAPERTSVSSL